MNALILNRQNRLPEDGWHQFEVLGDHVNHEAKVVQVIDGKAIESIVNRFAKEAQAPNFSGLLVDRDHFSLDPEHTSEAMGWAMQVRNREGVPEAKVDWTGVGRPLVEAKPGEAPTFKFFSSVYDPADCESLGTRQVAGKTYQVLRPLRLDRLALTNDPNNKGAKPISNRQPAATAARSESKPIMKSVLKLLGLADDASEESAVAAVQKIQNRASQADALVQENEKLLALQVETDLEKYKDVISNREKAKETLLKNRAGAVEFFEGLLAASKKDAGKGAGGGTEAGKERPGRITNRAAADSPAGAEQKAAKEAERAAKIRNRATRMSREEKISYSRAFELCEREEPAVV